MVLLFLAGLADVFPTRVGVNRRATRHSRRSGRIPHTRGGEPLALRPWAAWLLVFPTRVGVNQPPGVSTVNPRPYSPHAWG